jgi:DNA-binding response OmpR family regulator
MKILIAEDDATSRMILKSVLSAWEYEVVETQDGEEAWQLLQKEDSPRLVIVDWVMPGMSGETICRKLRETKPLTPAYIIILTSKTDKEDIVAGLEAGANDYIRKPFDRADLRARVRVGERVLELQSALADRIHELQDALDHVKTLQGLIPICMHCHKTRNDQQHWERLEMYISEHTDAEFSHGLCPDCMKKYYGVLLPELSQDKPNTPK